MDFSLQAFVTLGLAAVTGWVATLKWGMTAREKEYDGRLVSLKEQGAALQTETKLAVARVELAEKRLIELTADVRSLSKDYAGLKASVDEIKDRMVTTQLYEQRMSGMEKSLNKLLDDINSLIRQRVQYPSGLMRQPSDDSKR
jgi:chromosome segregation ATPase